MLKKLIDEKTDIQEGSEYNRGNDIKHMPPEIWLRVSDYLSGSDHLNFRLTCREFYKLTLDDIWINLFYGGALENRGIRTSRCKCAPWMSWQDHTCKKRLVRVSYENAGRLLPFNKDTQILSRVRDAEFSRLDSIGKNFLEPLINLVNLTLGVLPDDLSSIDKTIKKIPNLFFVGFTSLDTIEFFPDICANLKLVTLDTSDLEDESTEALEKVGSQLKSLVGIRFLQRSGVPPELQTIIPDDIYTLIRAIPKNLEYILIGGPLYNPINIDWIPGSVREFQWNNYCNHKSWLYHQTTVLRGLGVKRLTINFDDTSKNNTINYELHFPQLEHLVIDTQYREHITTNPWIIKFLNDTVKQLRSLKITQVADGLGFFDWFRGSENLECLIIYVEHLPPRLMKAQLPQLEFLVLALNMVETIVQPVELVNSILRHCERLKSFIVDYATLETLKKHLGPGLLANVLERKEILDKFNNYHILPVVGMKQWENLLYEVSTYTFNKCLDIYNTT